MRIWADMSAPAHVLVLRPIIEHLRERGHEVVVTSRDYTQTQELLALHGMEHPTLEEKAWRTSEPHTPHPRKRIEAVAELNRAGIPTGVLIAPLMPGINDSPKQVEEIFELCGEAGAVNIGGIPLHLHGEVREIFFVALVLPAGPRAAVRAALRARRLRRQGGARAHLGALAPGPHGRRSPRDVKVGP